MVFSTMIFLWLFLPIVLGGYYLLNPKYQNAFLLLASLLFYAWGEPKYVVVMIASIIINWGSGLLMERFAGHKKTVLFLTILLNLGILFYFKYMDFGIQTWNQLFGTNIPLKQIALPIGISFFTFQGLSYVIDLYRGKYPAQRKLMAVALYISFFPQLIAGPIIQYKDINEQLISRRHSTEKMTEGIRRFCYGLAKKALIANLLAEAADHIYALDIQNVTGGIAWLASLLYTFQIYYDFSGYSDMAIGLGKMFGFDFSENFNYPYLSGSIQEFWKRWHISLGAWFREYVYIPLGGNRKGEKRTYLNLVIVFFLTGLWHGASWNFVFWGLYHGLFSVIERLGLKKCLGKCRPVDLVYTFFVVNLGWVFFRVDGFGMAWEYVKRMLIPWKYVYSSYDMRELISVRTILALILGIAGAGLIQKLPQKIKKKYSLPELVWCMFLLTLCIILIASNTYNPFIYFRF